MKRRLPRHWIIIIGLVVVALVVVFCIPPW